jgi:hypothetical protein
MVDTKACVVMSTRLSVICESTKAPSRKMLSINVLFEFWEVGWKTSKIVLFTDRKIDSRVDPSMSSSFSVSPDWEPPAECSVGEHGRKGCDAIAHSAHDGEIEISNKNWAIPFDSSASWVSGGITYTHGVSGGIELRMVSCTNSS